MFNMFGNIFGRMFTPPAARKEEFVFEGAECVNCKAEAGYNPYCDGVRCYDKEDYLPEGYTEDELRSIYYDLNQEAGIDYLVESADFDEVDDYYNPGTEEVDPAFVLEAVTVKKFSRLEGVIRRGMLPVMKKHMKMKDPTTGEPINVLDPIVGKCKKSGGFAYVTAQIPFSDGQVVSIIFHAPEGDGKKIGPSDMVVAFRWLLNKRDITAVVAPEDGKEISLKTIALRLAQLVGKNAKRFAATQKEVQAEKRQLEELQEKQKELDEQAKTYEEQIAGAQEAKTSTAEEIGSLQAQLAKQLATNRELEVKLAGLKKLEEEGRKTGANQPEPEPKAKVKEGAEAIASVLAQMEEPEYRPVPTEPIGLPSGYKVDEDGYVQLKYKGYDSKGQGKKTKTWLRVNEDGTLTYHCGKDKKGWDATKECSEIAIKQFGGRLRDLNPGDEETLLPEDRVWRLARDIRDGKYDKNIEEMKKLLPSMKKVIEERTAAISPKMLNTYLEYLEEAKDYLDVMSKPYTPTFMPDDNGEFKFEYEGGYASMRDDGTIHLRLSDFPRNGMARKEITAFLNSYIQQGYTTTTVKDEWENVTTVLTPPKSDTPTPEPAPQVTEPEPVPAEPIEPEPAQDDKADKPEWVNDMQDIIDGKYDDDLKKMGKLLNLAVEELDKPGCDPKWEELANKAADRRTVLLKAKAKAAGF